MLDKDLIISLEEMVADSDHPRELAVDVIFAIQKRYGYLNDEALEETARLVGMTPLEIEEIATFYTFIYREPVGKYVIHVCDSVVCWLEGYGKVRDYLMKKLGIQMGETTPDGLFTLLPVCCIGYCDRAPAILINRKAYGPLTTHALDDIIESLRNKTEKTVSTSKE